MAATWAVINMERIVSLDSKDDVISVLHWECTDNDEGGLMEIIWNVIQFILGMIVSVVCAIALYIVVFRWDEQ